MKDESLSDKYSAYYNGFQLKDVKSTVQKLNLLILWLEDVWGIDEENYSGYGDWVNFKKKIDKIFGDLAR